MKKAAVTIFILYLLFPVICVSAEDAGPAVLARGPVSQDGIEYLGVNTVLSRYGEYRYGDDLIKIYYTDENIFLSDEWVENGCADGIRKLEQPVDDKVVVMVYSDRKGWHAFLSFPRNAEYICGFIKSYISRQNYFLNIARDKSAFSFPALLEVANDG